MASRFMGSSDGRPKGINALRALGQTFHETGNPDVLIDMMRVSQALIRDNDGQSAEHTEILEQALVDIKVNKLSGDAQVREWARISGIILENAEITLMINRFQPEVRQRATELANARATAAPKAPEPGL